MPPYLFDCLCWTARNWISASLNVGPTDRHGGGIYSGTQALKIRRVVSSVERGVMPRNCQAYGLCVLTKKTKNKTKKIKTKKIRRR